jgi:DNA repair photolyase
MNKQTGNMYPFVTHTQNFIKGKCSHDCLYCYVKQWGEPRPLRLDEKALKEDLGEGNFIFVGSGTDMFAEDVPIDWINRSLKRCAESDNKYLFQSKNPERMIFCVTNVHVKNKLLACTIESNKDYKISKAPLIEERVHAMSMCSCAKMITIEPILCFDLPYMVEIIDRIQPDKISIGADSKGHNMPEPKWESVQKLIDEINKRKIDLCLKSNLKRLKPKGEEVG